MLPIKYVFPLFLFNQMLAAFLRNDGDPGRATAAVLAGAEALWLAMPSRRCWSWSMRRRSCGRTPRR